MISMVRERLKEYIPRTIQCERTTMAGVVVPLLDMDGSTRILLTKRTLSVKAHKGEVSFPGGMYEEADGDTRRTALRETCEEVGIKVRDVEIIGRLDDLYTMTGFVITPYVGIIPYPYVFRPSAQEVDALIYLPFDVLLSAEPIFEEATHDGKSKRVASIYYEGDRIWGATCHILLRLREILTNEKV
jgi:8-oxo-dGTP pyrophosphatase MutT (NUDIX family)